MTREELLAHQKHQMHLLLVRQHDEVMDLTVRHRLELLALAIGEDGADRAIEVTEIITNALKMAKELNYPGSAEHEDAKWLQRTVDETLAEIKRKYGK
ncbi:hypothetical protein NLN92_18975 [Citrobacter portucalensis]|uniref:hypothetical protein n=1 Tax=Citrobacter freundii complex TaxID=1344959 RepID=UPI00226B14DC|nr:MULTISPECIES: hypothetical protein [Citrobacter freundii complex]MCX8980090.1 hypothetical protein [Citrobacter portucalensis]MEB2478124.1 hypothetical protein [Citrobacter freundii]